LGFEKEHGWVTQVKLDIRVSEYESLGRNKCEKAKECEGVKNGQGHKGGGEKEKKDEASSHLGSNGTLKMVKIMKEGEKLKMCTRLSCT
jgi:hypothetical protein